MFASPAVRKLPGLPVHVVVRKERKKRKQACAWLVAVRAMSIRSTLTTKKITRVLRRNAKCAATSTRVMEHVIADVSNL